MIKMGRWSSDRMSSGFLLFMSRKAAWMSGKEKAPFAGYCLMGCYGPLRNVLFGSMTASTRYSPLALGLSVWSNAVSWALTSAQIILGIWLELRQ